MGFILLKQLRKNAWEVKSALYLTGVFHAFQGLFRASKVYACNTFISPYHLKLLVLIKWIRCLNQIPAVASGLNLFSVSGNSVQRWDIVWEDNECSSLLIATIVEE